MTSSTPDDARVPEADAPADAATAGAPASDPQEDVKRRFREALARKRGAQHPDDAASGSGRPSGHAGGAARREFRRKSG